MISITKHAKKQLKRRLGLNKKCIVKIAEKAYNEGMHRHKMKGNLKRYVNQKAYIHDEACSNIICFNGILYVFNNDLLVTVYPVPGNLNNYWKDRKETREKV